MKQKCWLITVIFLVALISTIPINAFSADVRAAILANPCAGCHGTDGNSPGSIPSLADEDADEIKEELIKFKTDKKMGTIMNRIAKGYTDEEIDLIAQYFASVHK